MGLGLRVRRPGRAVTVAGSDGGPRTRPDKFKMTLSQCARIVLGSRALVLIFILTTDVALGPT